MQTILQWVPAAGGGSQAIQYKIRTSGTWTSFATTSATATSYTITGLNYNTLYDYQVVNNCPAGGTGIVLGSRITFQCPTLTITPADVSVTAQFFHLGGSVDSYKVDLLDAGGVTVVQTQTLLAPFTAQVTASFTGLNTLATYNIKVTPGALTFTKTDCGAVSFRTTATAACAMPTGLATTWNPTNPASVTLGWIAQPGITAQELWYGKTSVVGSTLPPSSGWTAGANLYLAAANSASITNLDINTNYTFALRSLCTTGSSPWATIVSAQLICPTITPTPHATSVDVALTIANPTQFANLVDHITLYVKDASNNPISNIVYAGPAITSPINANFQGLSASTSYNLVVMFAWAGSTTENLCSSLSFNTTATITCPILSFTVTNVQGTSFTINPSGLQAGDTYDVSIDNGVTWSILTAANPQTVTGLTIGITYPTVLRHNCAGGSNSLTPAQFIQTQFANFSIVDVWYTCSNSFCQGRAIYVNWAEIRRISDGVLIYRYDTSGTVPSYFTFVPGVLPGVGYSLTANWTVDRTKTNGVSNLSLKGNTSLQSWSPATGTIIQESINFTGSSTNNIQITASSLGPVCTC